MILASYYYDSIFCSDSNYKLNKKRVTVTLATRLLLRVWPTFKLWVSISTKASYPPLRITHFRNCVPRLVIFVVIRWMCLCKGKLKLTLHKQARKKELVYAACYVGPQAPHWHVSLRFSWWLSDLFFDRLTEVDFITDKHAAYLGLKMRFEIRIDYPAFVANDVSVRCKARNTNSVVLNISIVRHYSVQVQSVSQDDDQTSDLNCISFQWASYENTSPTPGCWSALIISHIEDDFIFFFFHTSKQTYVPDLTSLRTLVIILVTDLFANARHDRRHWPLCEDSSSSSFINRRLRHFFSADNTPCLRQKKTFVNS